MSFLILRSSAGGASPETFDYYIGPSGSDSNNGLTQSTPWAITAINTKRATYAGKRVGLLDGTYSLDASLFSGQNFDTCALQVASGSSGSPTVIQAVNAHQVTLDAQGITNEAAVIGQSNGISGATDGYVTLKNFRVTNKRTGRMIRFSYGSGVPGSRPADHKEGVILDGLEVDTLDHTDVGVDSNVAAISMLRCKNSTVRNCKVHDIYGGSSSEHEGYGIQIWTSEDCVVEYCTVYNCVAGVYIKNKWNVGHTVRFNYLDTSGHASGNDNPLYDFNSGEISGTTFTVNNNVLKGNRILINEGFGASGLTICGFKIFNNTCIADASSEGGFSIYTGDNSASIEYYNNIFAPRTISARGDVDVFAGSLTTCDYNCYPPSGFRNALNVSSIGNRTTYTSLANWQAATSKDANAIAADPLFVASGSLAAYYQLQVGSPCKNTGKSNGTSGGSAVDMGAWGNGATSIGCNF